MVNLNLIVDEHFSEKIHKLDIHVEQLLCNEQKSENDSKEINELRQKQIEQIEIIKDFNLKQIEHCHEILMEKWKNLNDESLIADKLEALKNDLILRDCVLMENKFIKSGMCLWIFGWHLNEKQLDFLR